MSEALFSYGTLQLRDVQLANYGRALVSVPDTLGGYRLDQLQIDDAEVVRLSGKTAHPIARHTGRPADRIEGSVFELTDTELAATDNYEVEPYRRVEVTLDSGRTAWAYVGPPLTP